ncbi:hypothetical protein EVAR_41705_1 [Eumeta japonica]|uniref:Uncharacterized protein n=1 Tax=Eumeta variegata TaxID=151549 RepID=A0A4C1VS33_EUMVA|nr:hypothetical protein EVAR_41705_1 [Eumeta japonica]
MLLHLAARSSRLTRGRAELSVDGGLRGAAGLVYRGLKPDSLFARLRIDSFYPRGSASTHPTTPGWCGGPADGLPETTIGDADTRLIFANNSETLISLHFPHHCSELFSCRRPR